MSTPHRGSILASNWIGRLASKLVRAPVKLLTLQPIIERTLATDPAALQLNRFPNSIDTLAPNNRFVRAINELPISRDVAYNSIIGDRGRGDTSQQQRWGGRLLEQSHRWGADRVHCPLQSQHTT